VARARPRVVYWFNQPTPYVVARFNAVACHTDLEFEAWFSEVRQADRSWTVDERAWRFPARYIPSRHFGPLSLRVPVPELRATKPDVFVLEYDRLNLALGAMVGRVAAKRLGFRVLPNFDAWSDRQWWREAAKHLLFRSIDGVKVPGSDGAALARRYGTEPWRAFTVRQSIDLNHYATALELSADERRARRDALGLRGCVFVYVGRLWRGKGLDELVTAYQGLAAEVGSAVSLLVIGDGVDEQRYRRAFESMPRAVMTGFIQQAELPQWYALADCLVFPTHGDPNGLVVEEAMAAGLPVIVSDACGDVRERVPEGVVGHVVPMGVVDVLRARMKQVALDESHRSAMAARSQSFVMDKSVEGYATDFEAWVHELLGQPAATGVAVATCMVIGNLAMMIAGLERWRCAPYVCESEQVSRG